MSFNILYNVVYQQADHISKRITFLNFRPTYLQSALSLYNTMLDTKQERQIVLAVTAFQSNPRLSLRRAAKIYEVPYTTLQRRMKGTTAKADSRPKASMLTALEEEAVVRYILELGLKGFSPRRANVEDMANLLTTKRNAKRVGKCWTDRFIQRQRELCTRFSRAYDYQRALQEDLGALNAWFRLVTSMRAKYGIQDCDFYNFDETGFMIGVICGQMVVTRTDRVGKPKAIQPGNREWATAICSIAADSGVVPPFLCVAGRFHLAAWYSSGNIPADWVVYTTPKGWTDYQTGLE